MNYAKTTLLSITPFVLTACSLFNSGGSNDGVIGDDDGNDEVGLSSGGDQLIPNCLGMPAFDLDKDGFLSDSERLFVAQSGGPDGTGEIGCYVPKPLVLDGFLNYPNPYQTPILSEGYAVDDPIMLFTSGMICNFVFELVDTPFSTDNGSQMPFYTGPFIDSNGEFTSRYTACWEPCGTMELGYTEPGYPTVNTNCKERIDAHTIDPDGNSYNDGVPLYNHDWNLERAYLGSSCQSPETITNGNIPPFIVNAQELFTFVTELVPWIGPILAESININDVPWTWSWFLFTGGCHFKSQGFKEIEVNVPTLWYWDTPCPNNYISIFQEEFVDALNPGGDIYWIKRGFCYSDGLTVSGYQPPPEVPTILAQLEENGTLSLDDWNKIILVQHAGGLSWPKDGLRTPGFDDATATFQLHPDLVNLIFANPAKYLEGVEVEIIEREDGSGDPKKALKILQIPAGSLLDALGYEVGDVIFSIRGKEDLSTTLEERGILMMNQFSSFEGDLVNEIRFMIGLSANDKAVTVMHERTEIVDLSENLKVQKEYPGLNRVEHTSLHSRHFFTQKFAPVK